MSNDNGNTALAPRLLRIDDGLDRERAGGMAISKSVGGVSFQSMADLMEFAKLMAISDICVRKHLRGNPGACLAICMQAVEWRMSPYAVANKSYVVNDQISYESQLIHAVIEQRAPLAGRLRPTYDGEGPTRTCTITAYVKGEAEPFVFKSAPFAKIQPKNSPLWQSKPDLQLFYNASRDWARMYFPDLILGVYADDEIARSPSVAGGTTGGDKLARLNASMGVTVPHPGDDAMTIDTSTGNAPPDDGEDIIDVGDGPDVSGGDAEPPAGTIPDVATWEKFVDAVHEAAMDQGKPESVASAALAKFKLSNAGSNKPAVGRPAREDAIRAVLAPGFAWDAN